MRSSQTSTPQTSTAPHDAAGKPVAKAQAKPGQSAQAAAGQAEVGAPGADEARGAQWVMGPDGRLVPAGSAADTLNAKARRRRPLPPELAREADEAAQPVAHTEPQDPAQATPDAQLSPSASPASDPALAGNPLSDDGRSLPPTDVWAQRGLDNMGQDHGALSMPQWATVDTPAPQADQPVLWAQASGTVASDASASTAQAGTAQANTAGATASPGASAAVATEVGTTAASVALPAVSGLSVAAVVGGVTVLVAASQDDTPKITLSLARDTGSNAQDWVSQDGTVQLGGLQTSDEWEYSTNQGGAWQAGSGASFSLAAGRYGADQIQVRRTKEKTNVVSVGQEVNIDRDGPAAPGLALATDAGKEPNDGKSHIGLITVSGLEAGASWEYSVNSGGSWSSGKGAQFSLAEGSYADGVLKVRQTDLAGNSSAVGASTKPFYIDQNDITPPVLSLDIDSGSSASDGISQVGNVTVGKLEQSYTKEYSTDGGVSWTNLVASTFSLAAGSYDKGKVQVRQTDDWGNSAVSKAASIVIDRDAPVAPTPKLANDSGSSGSDGVSTVGTVTVMGLEDGATWQYSSNGGSTWATGSGSSFSLAPGSFAANSVQVKQTDAAGNISPVGNPSAALQIDQSAAAPGVALARFKPNGQVWDTNDGTVKVSGLESGASWQYSVNSGSTWVNGSGSSFSLAANTSYAANAVQVRQTDVAGNSSAAGKNSNAINNNDSVTLLYFGLNNDAGSSSSDGISKDGSVRVSLVDPAVSWQYSADGGSNWSAGVVLVAQVGQTEAGFANGNIFVNGGAAQEGAPPNRLVYEGPNRFRIYTYQGGRYASGQWTFTKEELRNPPNVDSPVWNYDFPAPAHDVIASSFSLGAGSYAAGQVQIKQTVNEVLLTAQNAGVFNIDQTAPAALGASFSDTGSSSTDRISKLGTATVSGLEAGARWQFSTDSGSTWSDGSGSSFSVGTANALVSFAANQVQVRQTDVAGNVGAAGQLAAFTIDQVVATPTLGLSSDSGSSSNDGISNIGTVTVGALEAGGTWQYSSDGGSTWATGSGSSFSLGAGSYAANRLQVKQTDVAGNVSTQGSHAAALQIDQSVLAPSLALASDSGSSGSDGVSMAGTVTVSGLEAGATWQYSSNGGSTWATGSGNSFSLAQGSYAANSVQVKQTDVAGNISPVGNPSAALQIDQTIEAPGLALARFKLTGAVWETNDGSVKVSGLESGASWQYSVNSGSTWVNGSGSSFSLTANTSYAANAVQVRQTDVAGNSSAPGKNSNAINNNDSVTLLVFGLNNDAGSSPSDGITKDGTVRVTLVDPAVAWEYSGNGGTAWSTVSPVNGTAGTSFSLAAGSYGANQVRVRQLGVETQNAGALNIDQTAPAALSASFSDTGSSSSDRISKLGTLTVSGLEAGASWQFSTDGGTNWSAGSGSSFSVGTANALVSFAANQVQVRQTDVAGNVGAAGPLAAFTIDQVVATPTLGLSSDSGSISNDGISSIGTVTVGALEAGGTWQYSSDGGSTWATGSGSSFSLGAASYAANRVQVKQTDVAGNVSTPGSHANALQIDQGALAPSLALANDSGSSSSDGVSMVGTVNVSGLEAGATWQYSINSGSAWSSGVGISFSLAAGSYAADVVQVKQRDLAGNDSPVGKASALNIDQTQPAILTPSLVSDLGSSSTDRVTSLGTVRVAGLVEAGGSWSYVFDGSTNWQTGSGTAFSLPAGTYADNVIKVRNTDQAGNTSQSGMLLTIVDQVVATPSVALASDAGKSAVDGISKLGQVTVSGLEAGGTWQYSVDSGNTWSTQLAASVNSFSLAPASYGPGLVRVRQTDLAGNLSTVGQNALTLNIDQSPPATPTLALASDTGASASDGISQNGTLTVSGLEADATWQYSLNGGSSWTSGSGNSFSLAAGSYAANTVQVKQTDVAGNDGLVGNAAALNIESAPPTLVSASALSSKITLTFSEALGAAAGKVPTAADFSLSDNNTITGVSVSGATVVLTVGTPYTYGQANFNTTVSYTNGADLTDIQDLAGNEAASFSGRALVNNTPVTPVISAGLLGGVNNLDVRSKIVLDLNEAQLTAVAGKKIRIVNDGGSDDDGDPETPALGYQGENKLNDLIIDVATGATQMRIDGAATWVTPTSVLGSIC